MEAWPHQLYGVREALAAVARGERRVCVTSPTGGGKTRMMEMLARDYLGRGKKVVLYTDRKILLEQLSANLLAAGLYHGVRAAGYESELDHPFQVSSLQTEQARVLRGGSWGLHEADLALVDECHKFTAPTARSVLGAHWSQGAAYVGFTATPLGVGDLYDHLVVAGTVSDLRACGALVLCRHYGPDEPDLRKLQGVPLGEDLSEAQQRSAMGRPGLFGRVWDWFSRLNPGRRPTILFAPGVRESIWFAEQFRAKGVPAAHLDGEHVWTDGILEQSTPQLRKEVLHASRLGKVAVLCNRFVLREGVDAPWLEHGVFACVFGSLQSYLQAGGRLLRAHPGLTHVTVQDHGGNWWRHGSLNEDREWRLGLTGPAAYHLRADRLRGLPQPGRCPRCAKIVRGPRCPCGWERAAGGKAPRPVVTTDGTLVELHAQPFVARRVSRDPDGPKVWERMYHRSRTEKGRRTFAQAFALFAAENGWSWPCRDWPLMPKEDFDLYQLVADVPPERLTPKE